MRFTDIFIRRPVLATVVSLAIFVLGLRALFSLPVLQFPRTENAVVTITTAYYGADADVVAGFITTPLENAVAQANGIDYMTSSSTSGVSTITVTLRLNYDATKALTEINTKVTSVRNQLPPASQQSVIDVSIGQSTDSMYIAFNSAVLQENSITDFLVRVVQPKLQAVAGVQTAELVGARNFALRAWLDPQKLAAYNLTAADVSAALANNNYISGLGSTRGQMVQVSLNASTGLHSLAEFRKLVLRAKGSAVVRLEDVADVTLGADDYESQVTFDRKKAVVIGIKVAPGANLLQVIDGVRKVFPDIQAQLPQGLQGQVVYDATQFVKSSITEVIRTLIEGLAIVTLVIFVFLASWRSVLIPTIAIPLSLIGSSIILLLAGFSINLLTLLALVLAIGLVVDDAIIVVENVSRHLEEGMTARDASIAAARELTGPIVAMTIVLVAVYVPIGFQGGLTGALFTEFAFTLVGAVAISAIVALTLSPMLCSRLLKPRDAESTRWSARLEEVSNRMFEKLHRSYERALRASLDTIAVTVVFALIILGSIYFLYSGSMSELAPEEDQGFVMAMASSAPNASLQQRQLYSKQIGAILSRYPEIDHLFQFDTPGQSFVGNVLKPWNERQRSANEIQQNMQQDLNSVAGVRAAVFQLPPLPGSSGLPVQFVIQSTTSFEQLNDVSQAFMQDVLKSGLFMFLDTDLKYDKPQATLEIDRELAAQLGLTMTDIGAALSSMLGGGYVNYFTLSGRAYRVIPQVQQANRLNTAQLDNYYLRTASGAPVQLSTIAHIVTATVPQSINHFQQLNAATISGVLMPGVATGEALDAMRSIAKRDMPQGYLIDYSGQSRQYIQESSGFLLTFGFALIIIFLALAAQFESFRDPLIILISVPMSIAGALLVINLGLGGVSLNIYTQVGLVTLMGLISKHGILIVEFANRLQVEGKSKREAIEGAAGIRLRPILMTTAAMVLGVFPLIFASGAGAASRFNMGLVIATGMSIGTLFTLFVVPAAYLLIGADHHRAVALEAGAPGGGAGR